MADRFPAWVSTRLKVEARLDHAASAALFLTSLEGMHVLEAVGRSAIAQAAAKELKRSSRSSSR
jgi:hypothetical protein